MGMMRQYELVERVQKYKPMHRRGPAQQAPMFMPCARMATQKRANRATPIFAHPLEVAAILTELKLDDATIVGGVAARHDRGHRPPPAPRSTSCSARISAARRRADQDQEARPRSRRRQAGGELPQAPARHFDDMRVLLVKLADRLHNMRTLEYMPADKRSAFPRRRSRSMRRSPAAWACRTCATSWRSSPSAISTRKPTRR
jgi:guanosine-3',5'-bis(diphosphate) 3'-pyrophosphohydrolase